MFSSILYRDFIDFVYSVHSDIFSDLLLLFIKNFCNAHNR